MASRLPTHGFQNQLLSQLPARELELLSPHMHLVALDRVAAALKRDVAVPALYFPESGILIAIGSLTNGRAMAVGFVGREGALGGCVLAGEPCSLHDHQVLLPGVAWVLPAEAVLAMTSRLPSLQDMMIRNLQNMLLQSAEMAMSAGLGAMAMRLAHCLLICHDRIQSDEIELTHGALALALGVRRASVTDALHLLEGARLIRSLRSKIVIRDRHGLEELTEGAYRASQQAVRPTPAKDVQWATAIRPASTILVR